MVEAPNSGSTPSRQVLSCLSGIVMVGGSLCLAMPASAATEADTIRSLQNQVNTLQTQFSQMTAGLASSHSGGSEGLPMHGFMDVGFTLHSIPQKNNPNLASGFNVGALSFYLTPQFGDRVKALMEPNFEIPPDGSVSTDIERMQIGYTFSDAATLWGGRFHTPYGYWNTAFHHGALMQTSVLRPRFLDFEDKGGILPAHMTGLWATGKGRSGKGKVTYDAYLGNGPKIAMADPTSPASPTNTGILDINQAGDNNHQAMVGFNLGYEFGGSLDGLRLAVHSLMGDVDDDATPSNKTNLNMAGGAVVYLGNDWEIMGEYYHFSDKDKSGTTGTHKSWADYLQIGKNIGNLTPYIRVEKTIINQLDNYFNVQENGQSYTRQSMGLRYYLNAKAALKVEILHSRFAADTTAGAAVPRAYSNYRSVYVQYAIGF